MTQVAVIFHCMHESNHTLNFNDQAKEIVIQKCTFMHPWEVDGYLALLDWIVLYLCVDHS